MKKSAQVHQGLALSLSKGFTLVELLVVIAIIAILAAVVVLIINPLELTKRGRDAARLTDLANLNNAINVAVQEATGSGALGVLCYTATDTPPTSCNGASNDTGAAVRASNGTGWVKVDLSSAKSVSVPTLPADPINSTPYHYEYCAGTIKNSTGWEIDAVLESDQQKGKMSKDGGSDDLTYEVGSNLDLIDDGTNICTY